MFCPHCRTDLTGNAFASCTNCGGSLNLALNSGINTQALSETSRKNFANRRFWSLVMTALLAIASAIVFSSVIAGATSSTNPKTVVIGITIAAIVLVLLMVNQIWKYGIGLPKTTGHHSASEPRFGLRDFLSAWLANQARHMSFKRDQKEQAARQNAWAKTQQSANLNYQTTMPIREQLRHFCMFILTAVSNRMRGNHYNSQTHEAVNPRALTSVEYNVEYNETSERNWKSIVKSAVSLCLSIGLFIASLQMENGAVSVTLLITSFVLIPLTAVRIIRAFREHQPNENHWIYADDAADERHWTIRDSICEWWETKGKKTWTKVFLATLFVAGAWGLVNDSNFVGRMTWTICPLLAWWIASPTGYLVRFCSIIWGGMWLVVLLSHWRHGGS